MNLLVVDLDGTLADTLDDLALSLDATLAQAGRPGLPRERVRRLVGNGLPALVRAAFAETGDEATDADLAVMAEHYSTHSTGTSRLFGGARDALDALKAEGFRLAVCTNKPERDARAVLAALAIADVFKTVAGGDSFAWRKPDPRHLLGTIAAAGGVTERSAHLGDHPNDVRAAQAAGVPVIWAAWGFGSDRDGDGANAHAASWAEVPAIARRLLGTQA